jgi:hypothetical protein
VARFAAGHDSDRISNGRRNAVQIFTRHADEHLVGKYQRALDGVLEQDLAIALEKRLRLSESRAAAGGENQGADLGASHRTNRSTAQSPSSAIF